MSTPPEKLAASIGHQCQTGHDVLADVVLTQLATGETDILCQPCLVGLMSAVIAEVAKSADAGTVSGTTEAARRATEAATAALAAD